MYPYTNDRTVLWQISGNKPVCLLGIAGIFRLQQRPRDRDSIIFEFLLPGGLPYIAAWSQGYTLLSVRYVESGNPLDPHAGFPLFFIEDIAPGPRWVNHLVPTNPNDVAAITMRLQAHCRVQMITKPYIWGVTHK
jgi:hypothetical protein